MTKTRVAVIGLGKMGLLHTSLLNLLADVELVALCEKSSIIRRFAKKAFNGITVVSDITDLSNLGLDTVYITTPVLSHFPIVKAVYSFKIGRNVFIEKPLASSYTEASELCRLAQHHECINMVGYNRRYAVTFRKARGFLEEGTIGEPVSFEGYAYSSDFIGVKTGAKTFSKGGVLLDLGCHVIDMALWLFGEMEIETASFSSIIGDGSEDYAYLQVKTLKGVGGEFRSSWCMENYRLPEIGLIIKGVKGTIKVNDDRLELKLDDGGSAIYYRQDLDDRASFLLGGAEYFREDESFINALVKGLDTEPSFQTAARVEKIIDQAKRKARENE